MKKLIPLMRREWLQHRFGWLLMATLPLALGLLATSFGEVQVRGDRADAAGPALPALMTMGAIAGGAALMLAIVWFASFIIVSGLARRDHGDRSAAFWLSLPIGHAESLLSPMLVHLLLAPAAALLFGLAGGGLLSMVLVSRMAGLGAWLALPWGDMALATLAVGGRLLIGLPLATLWLLPLILAVVLLNAWFRKWSWVVIVVGVALGSLVLTRLSGQPLLSQAIDGLLQHAMHAMVNSATATDFPVHDTGSAFDAVRSLPRWAWADVGRALGDLASPLLLGGLLVAGACFALLVRWRANDDSAAA